MSRSVSRHVRAFWSLLVVGALAGAGTAEAQYFGRNKVQHEDFDFVVLKTEHFDIYHYAEQQESVAMAARMAERWYARLSQVLGHELSTRQPLVLYLSSPHFQQTTVIPGAIGEGTGGVTESLKRRIVLPFAAGLAETDHVLGHELVHAFQYDILGRGPAAGTLPLWFIEGMAEYLSIGSQSAQTAMWIRDAALRERLPTIEQLGHPRYFPYRFGHAFWAYVAGRWGDQVVGDALRAARNAQGRADAIDIIEAVVGVDHKTLTAEWHEAIAREMLPPAVAERRGAPGRLVLGERRQEDALDLGPALSRDGRRLAFLSAREQLSIDVFVADVASGRVERKVLSTAADPHLESLQFISSAGSWDPAGRLLAVAAVAKGKPILAIVNADTGNREREIALPGIDEAMHPAWSPDGARIALSVLSGGVSDLVLVDAASGQITRLTQDAHAELHPAWSPDGRTIAFTTDRYSSDLDVLAFHGYGLATIDVATRQIARLATGDARTASNPQYSSDGTLYFIATPGGVPNVHRLDPATGQVTRVTDVPTGISGITPLSPAISAAGAASTLAYVVFDGGYTIRVVDVKDLGEAAAPRTDGLAQLAPASRRAASVDAYMANPTGGLPPAAAALASAEPYRPRLGLDYVGQQFGAVGFGPLGARAVGGVTFLWSDLLGEHMLGTTLQVNGSFEDIGGQAQYINRTSRWNWGVGVEQIPYVTGAFGQGFAVVDGVPAQVEQAIRYRQVDQQVGAMTAYPFSRSHRVEFGASFRRISFEQEVLTRAFSLQTGELLLDEEVEEQLIDPISLGVARAALIYDTSVTGPTSPVLGQRYRLEVSPTVGTLQFTGLVADYRRYLQPVRPWTLAFRALHVGRYGGDAEEGRISPLFLGYQTLVRGYDVNSLDASECPPSLDGRCPALDRLLGSRIAVANLELRVPLVGAFTRNYDYGPVPVELYAFADAGAAWGRSSAFAAVDTELVRSVGAGLRVNALGFLVVQFDAARPLDRPNDKWRFQFSISPGF